MNIWRQFLSAVLCLILISSIAVPASALADQSERNPSLSEVTDWSHDAPVTDKHSVAALLLRPAADTEPHQPQSQSPPPPPPPASAERIQSKLNLHDEFESDQQVDLINPEILQQIESPLTRHHSSYQSQYRPSLANHSELTQSLRGYADYSARLDSRLNTSTRLLLAGDRELVSEDIRRTQQQLVRWEEELSPRQSERLHSQIQRAKTLIESTHAPAAGDSTAAMLSHRSNKFNQLSDARALAVQTDETIMQLVPQSVSITIDSRGDPIRNGSSTVTRNITGTVDGADPSDIETVEVTVNGNQTVNATVTQANSSRFRAPVTFSRRITTITATVTTVAPSPSGSSPGSGPAPGGGAGAGAGSGSGAGVSSTRVIVSTPPDATTRGFLNPDSSAVTVEFNEDQDLTIQELRVNSTTPSAVAQIRVAQFNSNPVSATPRGEFLTALDPILRETSDVASSPARIQLEVASSQLPNVPVSELTFVRYNQTTQNWQSVSGNLTVEQSSGGATDTVVARTTVSNPAGLLALTVDGPVSNSQSQSQPSRSSTVDDTDASPTDSDADSASTPEQPTQTQTEPEQKSDEDTPAAETQDEGGILRSLFDSIRSLFEGVIGTFEGVSPLQTVSAAPSPTVSMALDGSENPIGPKQVGNQPITDSTRLFLDGDGLTDTFELQEANTEPLTSRSNVTGANNSLVDGVKDPDDDTLINTIESGSGTDPLRDNTDGDRLTDAQESQFNQFNATTADSNGDGVSDGLGDPDGDGVITTIELDENTDPFDSDTDGDGLTDGEELRGVPENGSIPRTVSNPDLVSDPLERDSDDDRLADLDERDLGTIPTNNDTNGNGIIDGNETFTTATQTTLSTGGNASVDITGDGNVAGDVTISDGSLSTLNTSAVQQAQSSSIVEFESDANFSTANLTLEYDNSTVSNESELAVYRRNQTTNTFRPLNSTVNTTTQTVTATTNKFSRFAVFEVPEWESNFEAIEPPNVGGQSIAPVDAAFILDSSGSMQTNDPNNLRLQAAKEFTGALLDIDRASVIDFDFDAQVKQSLTSDFRAVNNSIDTIDSLGGTNIGAGVSASNAEFRQNSNDTRAKIAVLLTDGQGQGGISEAQQAASQNVTIFTIGLSQSADANKLQQIADETGGNFTQVNKAGQLPNIFSRIANTTQSDDADGDGLTNAQEIGGFRIKGGDTSVTTVRTDPFDPDTDGDGIPDGVEAGTETTNTVDVNVAGSGVSGLNKTFERTVFDAQSNPVEVDSDNDGLSDAAERDGFTVRFTDSASDTETFGEIKANNPNLELSDVSGLLNSQQVSSDPLSADTDGDGVPDDIELEYGTNPRSKDTDNDNINDSREIDDQPQTNPTLFDARGPTITIESIKVTPISNEEGFGPVGTPLGDTRYTVTYTVTDPAGIDTVSVKRGDDTRGKVHTGTNVTSTISVVSENFLAKVKSLTLGKRIQIKATDENGNGGTFRTKTKTTLYSKFVKIATNTLPGLFGSIANIGLALVKGVIDGIIKFVLGLAGFVESFISFLGKLLTNPGGTLVDIVKTLFNFGEAFANNPKRTIIGFVTSFLPLSQQSMRLANPFERPPGVSNVVDGIRQQINNLPLSDGFQPSDFTAVKLSDHTTFGLGYYVGLVLSQKVIEFLSGTIGTSLANKLKSAVNKVSDFASTISNKLSRVNRVTNRLEQVRDKASDLGDAVDRQNIRIGSKFDDIPGISKPDKADELRFVQKGDATTLNDLSAATQQGIQFGAGAVTRGIAVTSSEPRKIIALGRLSVLSSSVGSLTGPLNELEDNQEVDTASARFLSQYIAITGQDGVNAIQTLSPNSGADTAIAGLLNPSVSEPAKRVVTRGLNSGSIREGQAVVVLSALSSSSLTPAERGNLSRLVGASGSAGVEYVFNEGATPTTLTLGQVRQDPDAEFDEFSRLIRESGGQNVSQVSTPVILDVLSIENAAAAGARDNLIEATASGEISSAEATQFVSSIQSSSTTAKQRNQRINEVAFASNTTETGQVVNATA